LALVYYREVIHSVCFMFDILMLIRAYALQRHRPLTLQRTIDLPSVSPNDSDAGIISGFLDLVSLFQNFDDNFVSLWNVSSRTASLPYSTPEAISASANQLSALQAILATSIPDVGKRTEVQQADLLISRQWLKTMVWQLCVTKGLLSSSSREESMSLDFPVTIARDVVSASRILGREAFEPHGPGIVSFIEEGQLTRLTGYSLKRYSTLAAPWRMFSSSTPIHLMSMFPISSLVLETI